MAARRRFEQRIVLALLLVSLMPLGVGMFVVRWLVQTSLAVGRNPDERHTLERAADLYRDFLASRREVHAEVAAGLAASDGFAASAQESVANVDARGALEARLRAALERRPRIVEASVRRLGSAAADGGVPAAALVARATHAVAPAMGDELEPPKRVEVVEPIAGTVPPLEVALVFEIERRHERDFEALGGTLRELDFLDRLRDNVSRAYTLAGIFILALVGFVAFALGIWLSRGVTQRVATLAEGTRRVSTGDLDFELPAGARANDELGDLVRAFNGMVRELKENRDRIVYLEKVSAWQEVARRLAHEIKNPLTPINLSVQELQRTYKGDDARYQKVLDQSAQIITEEVATLKRLVEEFSAFAKLPDAQRQREDLSEIAADFVTANPQLRENADVELFTPPGPVPVSCDRLMLRQVLGNLVRNAVEACRGGTARPRVLVRVEADARAAEARLIVIDNGCGLPEAERRRIFDPYFTTKSDGTGLGLAIVRKIVLMHGGEITAENVPPTAGKGAVFRVVLPLLERASG